jgi:O-antigen/teichoic acid export membrane protein
LGALDELNAFMKGIAHLMFWPTLGAFLFLLAFGPWVLSWFGGGFEVGYVAMIILVGGLLVRNTVGPIEYLLNMTGNQNASLMALGTAGIVNLCFNALLIPDYGMQGAAMATALSYVVGTSLLVIMLKRRLGMTSFVFLNWPKLS